MLKGQKKSTPYKLVKLRCRNCLKIVERHYYLIETFKYCSAKCKQLASRGRVPKNKIKYLDLIPSTCVNFNCKKVLMLVPHKAKSFRFCSRSCLNKTFINKELLKVQRD